MKFTLDQLIALESIARTGSFARAAEEIHRVPSAVSYLIRELECSMGIEIFDRSRRKAKLTPAGDKILHSAREVLHRAKLLERSAKELKEGWEPHLHVVVDGALPIAPITKCLRRFADPGIPTSLRIDVEYQEGVIDVFEETPADIALVLGFDGDGDEEGYECTPLPELNFLLVATPSFPLTGIDLTESNRLNHAELVVRDSSPRFKRHSKPSFMGSSNVVFLPDFHSKRIALLDSAGYGWIPRHFIEADLKQGKLKILGSDLNTWTYNPQLITKADNKLGRGAALFIETLFNTP